MLYSLRISLGLVFPLSNDVSLFFIFILLFWNHILMCFSERLRDFASSILRALVMYRLNRNSFSNSTCCLVVYAVLARERTVAELQDSRPRPLGLSSAVKKKKSMRHCIFKKSASKQLREEQSWRENSESNKIL